MMNNEETGNHIVTYSDVKEPQKQLIEKHGSPRKGSVLSFNPDGSLCIPADLKEKLSQKPLKTNPSKLASPKNSRSSTSYALDAPSHTAQQECEQESSTSKESSSKENVTPDSTRKRKKNAGPRSSSRSGRLTSAKTRKSMVVYVKPDEGCCHFCYTNDVSRDLGELREIDEILGHHSCLLFSSGLCQAGKNEEGLWGFLLPDIKKELSRGKRLKCSFCRQPGALVGCQKARCQYTYHFTCGITHGCLMQYYDNFRSYCVTHRPLQYFVEEMIGQSIECAICGDAIRVLERNVPRDILVTECCNMTPLHRACIQNQADASGYFFRCPMCNNEKKFNSVMKIMGVNVPQSDAVWEKGGYFDELLEEYWRCDVPICLHQDGRKGDSRNKDQWDLMKCMTCGQSGAHPACLGYEKRGPKDWNCSNCLQIEVKLELERQEELKNARDNAAKLPDTQSPGSSSQTTAAVVPTSPKDPSRSRKKTLSPSKDPFLMTPAVLKEAVFKLCVAKLKQMKMIRKNLDPNKWTGINLHPAADTPPSEEEEEAEVEPVKPLLPLTARTLIILLTKLKYTPPPPPPDDVVASEDEEEEVKVHDEQKERLFELCLKMMKEGVCPGKRGRKRSRQTSLNSFFKRKHKDSNDSEETNRPKRRKVKSVPSTHEPFPFNRSPHSIADATELQSNSTKDVTELQSNTTKEVTELQSKSTKDASDSLEINTVQATEFFKDYIKIIQRLPNPTKEATELQPQTDVEAEAPATTTLPLKASPETTLLTSKESLTSTETRMLTSPKAPQTSPKPLIAKSPEASVTSPKAATLKSPKTPLPKSEKASGTPKSLVLKTPTRSPVLVIMKSPTGPATPPSTRPLSTSSPLVLCPSPNVYKCYYCSDKFTKLSVRMEHMRSTHPTQMRGWSGTKGKGKAGHCKTPPDEAQDDVILINDDDTDDTSTSSSRRSSRTHKPSAPRQGWDWKFVPQKSSPIKKKGRLRRKKPSSCKDKDTQEKKVSIYEEEMMKYDDLCIEDCPLIKEEEKYSSFSSSMKSIFALPPLEQPKKSGRATYDWTEGEIASMIEFYSLNSPLWDHLKQDETNKSTQDELIQQLERKLSIPAEAITTKWKSLLTRYKHEKHSSSSTWRYLPQLHFLEQNSLVSCPEDVSPLFSLLNAKSSSVESSPELSKEGEEEEDLDNSQDIFDMSDEDEEDHGTEDYFDNQEYLEEENNSFKDNNGMFNTHHDKVESTGSWCNVSSKGSADRTRSDEDDSMTSRHIVTSRDMVTSRDKMTSRDTTTSSDSSFPHDSTPEDHDTTPEDHKFVTPVRDPKYREDCTASDVRDERQSSKKLDHVTGGPHVCSECSKGFESRADLTRHKLKLRYFCVHCSRNYTTLAKLKAHQKSLDTALDVCPFCAKVLHPTKHMLRHIGEQHLDKWTAHECKYCGSSFKRKEWAIQHVRRKHALAPGDSDNWVRLRDFRCLYD